VVALGAVPNVSDLAASIPGTRFLAVDVPGAVSTGNLVVVNTQVNPDYQAFMAGYIAAVEADDWRVGIVYTGDEAGKRYRNAFLTGAIYYCGSCVPYHPPYNGYPLDAEVPPGSGIEAYQQAVDSLVALGVNTMHLAPSAQSDDLYRYAASKNVRFVGTAAPPAGLEGNWIASVIPASDVDLSSVISQVISGQTNIQVQSSIQISFTGLSEGRLAFFKEMIDELESGVIDPQGSQIQ